MNSTASDPYQLDFEIFEKEHITINGETGVRYRIRFSCVLPQNLTPKRLIYNSESFTEDVSPPILTQSWQVSNGNPPSGNTYEIFSTSPGGGHHAVIGIINILDEQTGQSIEEVSMETSDPDRKRESTL